MRVTSAATIVVRFFGEPGIDIAGQYARFVEQLLFGGRIIRLDCGADRGIDNQHQLKGRARTTASR
jgi:hypothetical protein